MLCGHANKYAGRPKKAINHHYLCNFFCRVHVEESADGRGRDLVFRSLQVDDEGEYSCEAIIDGMNEKKIFYLKVIGKKNHSRNLVFMVSIGDTVFFIMQDNAKKSSLFRNEM